MPALVTSLPGAYGVPNPPPPALRRITSARQFNAGGTLTIPTPSRGNTLIGIATNDNNVPYSTVTQSGWVWNCLRQHVDTTNSSVISIWIGRADPTLPTTNSTSVAFTTVTLSFPTLIVTEFAGDPFLGGAILTAGVFSSSGNSTSTTVSLAKPRHAPCIALVGATFQSGGTGITAVTTPAGFGQEFTSLGAWAYSIGPMAPGDIVFSSSRSSRWSTAYVLIG